MMANIHIKDSHKISKWEFRDKIISEDRYYYEEYSVLQHRTMYSLITEWAVHNFCYNLGLWRDHTADVDLDYPCQREWLYKAVGWFCWIWIK